MGKTPKPLKIAVTEHTLLDHPVIREWLAKGHVILPTDEPGSLANVDLVIGERAHYMTPAHLEKYGEDALKTARARAYPRKEKS